MLGSGNKKKLFLITFFIVNLFLGLYYFILQAYQKDGSFQQQPICLFVDNVRSGFWQAILYATYQFSHKKQIPLISFDSFQKKALPDIDVCMNNQSHNIYGWQKHSDVLKALQSKEKALTYIHQLYPTLEIAKLIVNYLKPAYSDKKIRIALLLGNESFSGHQALSETLEKLVEPHWGEIVFTSFSPDLIAYQSFALSDLLSKKLDVDYIIATDTATLLSSRHIKNNKSISSKLISLSLSKKSLSGIKEGVVEAALDLKLVKNTLLYLDTHIGLEEREISLESAARPEINIITQQNLAQVNIEDSFVPYGYHVFYNHLYVKNER